MFHFRELLTGTIDSQNFNDLPDDFTRLLWLQLLISVGDEGRGTNNPAWIRSILFPIREDVTDEMIEKAMKSYSKREMVIKYQDHRGENFFEIINWSNYQGNSMKEGENPSPTLDLVQTNTRPTQQSLNSHSSTDSNLDGEKDVKSEEDPYKILLTMYIYKHIFDEGSDLKSEINFSFDYWDENFPDRPASRSSEQIEILVKRLQNEDFYFNYCDVLDHASLPEHPWNTELFTFDTFISDEQNWKKILDASPYWINGKNLIEPIIIVVR